MMTRKSATCTTFFFLACLVLPGVAAADEPTPAIIAYEGIAFSRMAGGEVIAYDPVAAYDEHQVVVADCSAHQVEYQGVSWCFANGDNEQSFLDAAGGGDNHYVPLGGGRCAYGLSRDNLGARGDPRTAIRIGEELVLNGSFGVRARFLRDTERRIDNARLNYRLGLRHGDIVGNAELTER